MSKVAKKRNIDPCKGHWEQDSGNELKMYSEIIYQHYTWGRKRQQKKLKEEKKVIKLARNVDIEERRAKFEIQHPRAYISDKIK